MASEVDFFTENGPRLYLPDERVKQQRQIQREMDLLGIEIRDGEEGRRCLEWEVHPESGTRISITEIPGPVLTVAELSTIDNCRGSYKTWGVKNYSLVDEEYTVERDIFDGLGEEGPIDTHHFIALTSEAEAPPKTTTFRLVSFKADYAMDDPYPGDELMYDDIDFHGVSRIGGPEHYGLRAVLDQYHRLTTNQNYSAVYSMSSISRIGTDQYQNVYPDDMHPAVRERKEERTALAFALIQVLKAVNNPSCFDVCTLLPSFKNLLAIKDEEGLPVTLDFKPTQETTGLDSVWEIDLDNDSDRIKKARRKYPGYFNDSEASCEEMLVLAQQGRLRARDFYGPYRDLLVEAKHEPYGVKIFRDLIGLGLDPNAPEYPKDVEILIRLLTTPRNFKHLSQLLMREGQINPKLSVEELCQRLFRRRGAPYSALLPKEEWVLSNLNLLRAASEKYAQMPSVFDYT